MKSLANLNLLLLCVIGSMLAQFSAKAQPNNPSAINNPLPPNVWLWAKYADCNVNKGNAIATDSKGNVYITGQFNCPYFSLTNEITIRYSCGSYGDVFVAKYDSNGKLLWANAAGGNGTANSTGIAVDSIGNVYVTGYFNGMDIFFDRYGTHNLHGDNAGASNLFLAKYDATGAPVYVRCGQSVPGTNVKALSVSCGKGSSVYITGSFMTKQFYWANMTLTNDSAGFEESFVAQIDGNYGYPTWGLTFGGAYDERACSVAADQDGNAYVGGYFYSTTMYAGNDSLQKTTGISNAFIARVDNSGNLLWMRGAGNGDGLTQIKSVSTDASGSVYVEGVFSGSNLSMASTTLSNTDVSGSSTDIMYARYDIGGNLVWANSFGSNMSDEATGISANGDMYLVGNFYGTSISVGSLTLNNTNSPASEMFFIKANQMGTLTDGRSDGDTQYESVAAVSYDKKGNAHATGWFTDHVLQLDTNNLYNYKGGSNMFVGKIGQATAAPEPTVNTTGVLEIQKSTELSVFPNPTNATLFLDGTWKGQLEIVNCFGQVVMSLNEQEDKQILDVSRLSQGLYLIRLSQGQSIKTTYFIKEAGK